MRFDVLGIALKVGMEVGDRAHEVLWAETTTKVEGHPEFNLT